MIIWIASYPRSGNTFFRVILNKIFGIKTYSIYDDKRDIGADEATSEVVGHEFLPDGFDIEKARDEEKLYYIKTHELLNYSVDENDKAIYLIRDGREATLSFTNHQNVFNSQKKNLVDTIYGNSFIGSWGEHVASWDPENRKNTLTIKFEELVKDPIKFIDILSKFLEANPVRNKIPTFEELKNINPNFFRSGKANSWEDVFTREEHLSFWLKNYKQMDKYSYDYKKPDRFNELLTENVLNIESIRQNNYLINLLLEKDKKLQTISNRLNKFNQSLEEQKRIIQQKNQEVEEQKRMIQQKNQELEKKEKVINQQTLELQALYLSKRYRLATALVKPYVVVRKLFKGKLL